MNNKNDTVLNPSTPLTHLKDQSPEVINIVSHFSKELLSQGKNCGLIIEKPEEYPNLPILDIYVAMLNLYDMSTETFSRVKILIQNILTLNSLSVYEKSLSEAMLLTVNKQFDKAIQQFELVTTQWPEDLISFKFCEYLYFIRGYDFCKQRFLAHCTRLLPHHRTNPYFLASHSFALSLNKEFSESEKMALEAINMQAINPWAHHALAHVYLMQGQIDKGLSDLQSLAPLWEESAWTAQCHNSWHLGLFMIANMKLEEAESLCMDQLWKGMIQNQFVHVDFDVVSLLWRLQLAGHNNNPETFTLFKGHFDAHINNLVCPYQTAHYLYALIKGGENENARELLAQVKIEINFYSEDVKSIWENAIPFLDAVDAFGREDYELAARKFDTIITDVNQFGGSDGQIDLFYQTYLHCLIQSQQLSKASTFLKERYKSATSERAPYPLEKYWQQKIAAG